MRLKSLDCLKFTFKNNSYIGGNQNWYDHYTKRLGSCGTLAAVNMLIYLGKTREAYKRLFEYQISFNSYKEMMDRMYLYVTPTELYEATSKKAIRKLFGMSIPPTLGIRNQYKIMSGMKKYAGEMDVKLKACHLSRWVGYKGYVEFIKKGLEEDCPVALRNMFQGIKMDFKSPTAEGIRSVNFRLHWVTVIGIIEKERTMVEVLTWGGIATVDLEALWQANRKSMLFPLRAFYLK